MTVSQSPPAEAKLELCNKQDRALEVMVEPYPDRYVLQPGDTMLLTASAEDALGTNGFTINAYDGSIQIYADWDAEPVVLVNGWPAEPDWKTPVPGRIS